MVETSPSRQDLRLNDFQNHGAIRYQCSTPALIELAIRRGEGRFAANGALVVETGQFTGRSPKDKYIVRDSTTEQTVHWGNVNQPLSPEAFDRIHQRVREHLSGQELFIQDCFGGADPAYRLPIRVVATKAWHALFGRTLFLRPTPEELQSHRAEFTLIFAPDCQTDPATDGTRSTTCIAISFARRTVIIAGTHYAGELKKSVFTLLNYLLPDRGVFPMHCSANAGPDGDVALFFGLSGTGKTTLSADPQRGLIGDDEHGWSDRGVFNFEGGCYAKAIKLTREKEPQIFDAIRFGSVLENVVLDEHTRQPDFDTDRLTENTRAAYPIDYIDNAVLPSAAGQPRNIIFLTADAYGVLPPIARLTPEQAMYHFLSGYTAKLAGTERGLGKEPVATFSACFGEPFLPRHPEVYARMLGDRMRQGNVPCWLVNTGWTGGPYGVGERMQLSYTRAMIHAALAGQLADVATVADPVFGVHVPVSCPGVPSSILNPRNTWANGAEYDEAAARLAGLFRGNFAKFGTVGAEIRAAGPAGR